MKKYISIIIATFNSERYLERCLKSVVRQKGENIQLIIVDNASTDGTLKLLNQFQEYIDFLISERDDGIYDAWNKGLKVSEGEWIMFLGSDDILLEGTLNHYCEFVDNTVYFDYIAPVINMVNSSGNLLKVWWSFVWMKFKNMNMAHVGALHNRKLFGCRVFD